MWRLHKAAHWDDMSCPLSAGGQQRVAARMPWLAMPWLAGAPYALYEPSVRVTHKLRQAPPPVATANCCCCCKRCLQQHRTARSTSASTTKQ